MRDLLSDRSRKTNSWGEAMKFVRLTEASGAGKDTHTHRGYKLAYQKALEYFVHRKCKNPYSLDLFARECTWADIRNDLNPEYFPQYTNHCQDALALAKEFDNQAFDVILFDPPFSDRQSKDKYGTSNLYTNPAYIADLGNEMYRLLKPNGLIVKAGYNSNPPFKGMVLVYTILSHYGGSRNDVIFTIWQKKDMSLSQFA